jgi:hypothetical protein
MKYFEGGWTEPGLGGQVTPVIGTPTGWAPAGMDAYWGPSVHWNSHLGIYVALLNRATGHFWKQEGLYVSLSSDLLSWSPPERLMAAEHFYPQVVGGGPGETDRLAGQRSRLFVSGASFYEIEVLRPGEVPSHLLVQADGPPEPGESRSEDSPAAEENVPIEALGADYHDPALSDVLHDLGIELVAPIAEPVEPEYGPSLNGPRRDQGFE